MNIIKIIKNIFIKKDSYEKYHLKEEDDDDYFSVEERIQETNKNYENGLKELKKSKKHYRNFDPLYISIFQELERQKNYKIRFEFIPKHQNYKNVRSYLQFKNSNFSDWKKIRDTIENRYKNKCCICQLTSQDFDERETTLTQCHEVWHFDDIKHIQKLMKLESLCVRCHQIKHINRFHKDETIKNMLLKQYAELNNISIEQANKDYEFATAEKKRLNEEIFILDLSLINKLSDKYNLDFCEVENQFNPHTQAFKTFLEKDFKNNKNLEE